RGRVGRPRARRAGPRGGPPGAGPGRGPRAGPGGAAPVGWGATPGRRSAEGPDGLVVGPRGAVARGLGGPAVPGADPLEVLVEGAVDTGLVGGEGAHGLVVAVAEVVAGARGGEREAEGVVGGGGAVVGGPVEAVGGPGRLIGPGGVPALVAGRAGLGPARQDLGLVGGGGVGGGGGAQDRDDGQSGGGECGGESSSVHPTPPQDCGPAIGPQVHDKWMPGTAPHSHLRTPDGTSTPRPPVPGDGGTRGKGPDRTPAPGLCSPR